MLRLLVQSLRNNTAGANKLACVHRNVCVATTALSKSADGGNGDDEFHHLELIKPEVLFTKENRQRFLERMQQAPPLGMKLSRNKPAAPLAAVLICICTDIQGEISILYTRRSRQLSRHTRQISFPGGLKDPTDTDFVECALRETEEEVGLPRSRVQIWGTGKLIKPPHTAAIMPVVGTVENFDLCELNVNEDEVEEAFIIPMRRLVQPDNVRHTQFKGGFSSPTFMVGQYRVWGITGYITSNLLNCLIPVELKKLKRHAKYIKPYKDKWE